MALWNIPQRQVILRSNQLKADSATALATAYSSATVGATEMSDRAVSFPADAVNDALLNSGGEMVKMIGADASSPYRPFFAGVTSSLATGATIPVTSSASKPVVGVIGDVRDASMSKRLTAAPYEAVIRLTNITSYFNTAPHHYYTDNTRIWHTRTNVVADVVVWSEADQRTLMASTPTRGECPFPEALIAALVEGALSFLFRGEFNIEQAELHRARWLQMLNTLGMKTDAEERIAAS